MSILRQVVSGATWNAAGQIAGQVVSLGTIIILARLLKPGDFGLVAMVYVVRGLAYIFAQMGISSAIIQKKNIDNNYLSTAYWTTFIGGIVIALLVAGIAPAVSWFFKRPELTWITIVTSSIFILGGVSGTHQDLLERNMRFRDISIINVAGSFFGSVVAVIMAFNGAGYWSLVVQEIAATGFKVPLFWKISNWRPKFVFCRQCFKDIFGFSSFVLMSTLLNFFDRNGDNIIIGKFLGAAQLGFYSLAYNLMLKPLQYISQTTSRALFPALSKVQDDKSLVRKTYLQMVKMISLITFPMMTGLSLISHDVILLVYGEKWLSVVPVFSILCFVGAWQSVGTTVGVILLSQGRPSLAFKMTLFISPFVWLAFWIGTFWGIQGVAVCYATVSGIWWLISHSIANSIINLRMKTFLTALVPAAVSSLIMGLGLLILHNIAFGKIDFSLPLRLLISVGAGSMVYLSLLFIYNDDDINLFKEKIIAKVWFRK
jgi:O-antigen/teichoic acid export membrane protein